MEQPRGTGGPVIVITYAHTGAELLRDTLSQDPSLACTSGTGILPVCHAALATWRAIEGREAAASSALAIRSVRALANTMITAITAGSGASRWCETSIAAPETAEAFLQVIPSTVFVCLHRALAGVLADGLKAYPWGLGGSPFWQFAGPHPGNNVATIAAYWATCTEQLLNFEERHRDRCVRVTYEDLANYQCQAAGLVYKFLGVDPAVLPVPPLPTPRPPQDTPAGSPTEPDLAEQLLRLPRALWAKINELHDRLTDDPHSPGLPPTRSPRPGR